MKQLAKYILERLNITNNVISERLVLSKNKKSSVDSFATIQMFMQEDLFDNNGASLIYFKGISWDDQLICYVEYFDQRFGNRFMLVIFNDDIYLDLVNKYKLKEDKDLGWNEAPKELVEIVHDKLDTELPVYICGAGLWYDTRYHLIDFRRYEKFIEKVYNELK